MDKYKILIADDEPDVLDVLERRLSQEGYEVISAKDGEEALKKIYKEEPDVIILDILMPKKDGLAVLKELREHPLPHKWQPVIIVSVLADLEDIKKGYKLEADYYLTKPFNIDAVLKGIKTMLNLALSRKTKRELEDNA